MTDSTNEVDGDDVAQPRFSLSADEQPKQSQPARHPIGLWVASVPVVVLLVTVLAFYTSSDVSTPPPELQSFARPATISLPPRIVSPKPKLREPIVRVNVTPGGDDSFQLELRGKCQFHSLEPNDKLAGQIDPGKFEVTSTKKGLKLGTRQYATSQLELDPGPTPTIRVNGHLYRGRMRLFRRTDGKVSAVNVLPIEEYLASVVDSEMPAKFPEAARKAQAIVARTYALYQIEHADPKAVYDLLASQRSQKYLGVEYLDATGRRLAGESESSRKVVAATRSVVCQQNKKLFCAYYSAVCGGHTTDGKSVFKDAADVVQSVPCEWCRESPHFRWKTEIPHQDFRERTLDRNQGNKQTAIRSVRQHSGPGNGAISRFEIDDGRKPVSMTGIELRERMPSGMLASPHFQINLEKDRVVFEGRGHGHGVGFCQWGAKGQAESGRSHLDIIRHYYPGVEIATLDY